MADDDRSGDAAAFAAEQKRNADDAKDRADALRDDADHRKRSAAEHRAAIDERLHQGVHRDNRNR